MTTLGIDLTGAPARAVRVDSAGRVLSETVFDRLALEGTLRRLTGEDAADAPIAAGIAVDLLEPSGPARDACARILPLPLYMVNPGAAAMTAEHCSGAAQGARHALSLWVADRVYAGLLMDGRPWLGAHGAAGAAAWFALNPVERQDYRRLGGFAAEVSQAGVARRLVWRVEAGDRSGAVERAGVLEAITAAHVFAAAGAGDAVAGSVVRDTARYIGMAAANLAAVFDPELIVIAGLPPPAGDLLMGSIRKEAAKRLPPPLLARFRCELSPLGEAGIAIGAAHIASGAVA